MLFGPKLNTPVTLGVTLHDIPINSWKGDCTLYAGIRGICSNSNVTRPNTWPGNRIEKKLCDKQFSLARRIFANSVVVEWDKALRGHATLHLLAGVSRDNPEAKSLLCDSEDCEPLCLNNDKSVDWPVGIKFRKRVEASKPQTNYCCRLLRLETL